jgi:hypothetical protein
VEATATATAVEATAAKAATAVEATAAKAATAMETAASKSAASKATPRAAEATTTIGAGVKSRRAKAWSALEVRARLDIGRRLEAAPRRCAVETLG